MAVRPEMFRIGEERGRIQLAQPAGPLRGAFFISAEHHIPLADAFIAALAETAQIPALVAEAGAFRRLQMVAAERPDLRVVHLVEYMRR